jgi:hypothetical protein
MGRLMKSDLLCYGAMACVTAGVVMNIVYLQLLQSAGPSRLVLIPVGLGLAAPFAALTARFLLHARRSRFLEAVAAGAVLYLVGSGVLSATLPSLLQSRTGL